MRSTAAMLPPILHKIAALVQRRPRPERRGAKRLTPTSLTTCQTRRAGEDKPHAAWIHNLSKTGVGVLTATEFPPGTMIQIVIINAAHTFALSGEVQVV